MGWWGHNSSLVAVAFAGQGKTEQREGSWAPGSLPAGPFSVCWPCAPAELTPFTEFRWASTFLRTAQL